MQCREMRCNQIMEIESAESSVFSFYIYEGGLIAEEKTAEKHCAVIWPHVFTMKEYVYQSYNLGLLFTATEEKKPSNRGKKTQQQKTLIIKKKSKNPKPA